jgi:4-amino-4-deoxy-L-arabinose transferase-like glycosyltransferase
VLVSFTTKALWRGAKPVVLFLIFAVLLGYGLGRSGLASPFSDPVDRVRAQDETTYASLAVGAATNGDWITPKVLGRYFLQKPPLLIWLAGLSMKLLGISAFALRLPVLLVACGATLLVFLWSETEHSRKTACLAAFLLIMNPLWHTLGRICYTDILLTASMLAALFAALRDPFLLRQRTILIIGAAIAAGVMAKNLAGVLPIVILVPFYHLSRNPTPWSALVKICGIAALLVAPWHLYQLVYHRSWFWADYVEVQLLEFGRHPPDQHSADGPVWFYLKRLALTDPLLCLLVAVAAPSLWRSFRKGRNEAALVLSWILVIAVADAAFRYRNLPYIVYMIPPLCLAATGYGPLASGRGRRFIVAAAVLVFVIKVTFNTRPWGLSYGTEPPIPAEHWLHWYANLGRPNELIAVNADDEFYAMTLPLKVHYCFIDRAGIPLRYEPHYEPLGITVTAQQFQDLEQWAPQFSKKLREWGLDSPDPIATSIVASSTAEIVQMVEAHPGTDFYIPSALETEIRDAVEATHRVVAVSPERFFLLSIDGARSPTSSRRTIVPAW